MGGTVEGGTTVKLEINARGRGRNSLWCVCSCVMWTIVALDVVQEGSCNESVKCSPRPPAPMD